ANEAEQRGGELARTAANLSVALGEKDTAYTQLGEANTNLKQTLDDRNKTAAELRRTLTQLRDRSYAADMHLAVQAWDNTVAGSAVRLDELLREHFPRSGETDRRGFEWHYLDRLRHRDLLTLRSRRGQIGFYVATAFSPDGQFVAGSVPDNAVKVWDARTG